MTQTENTKVYDGMVPKLVKFEPRQLDALQVLADETQRTAPGKGNVSLVVRQAVDSYIVSRRAGGGGWKP